MLQGRSVLRSKGAPMPRPTKLSLAIEVYTTLHGTLSAFTATNPSFAREDFLEGVITGMYGAIIGIGTTKETCAVLAFVVQMFLKIHDQEHAIAESVRKNS